MSSYSFKYSQRYAVYKAFDGICQWCKLPVEFKEFNVDHVLPEDLLSKLDKLELIKLSYGLPIDFNINDYENWTVLHASCNQTKNSKVYEGLPLVKIMLDNCANKKDLEQKISLKLERDVKSNNLLATIKGAVEGSVVDLKSIQDFVLSVDIMNIQDDELSDLTRRLHAKIDYQTEKMDKLILNKIGPNSLVVLEQLVSELGSDWQVMQPFSFVGDFRTYGETARFFLHNTINSKYDIRIFSHGHITNKDLVVDFMIRENVIGSITLDCSDAIDWDKYKSALRAVYKAELAKII